MHVFRLPEFTKLRRTQPTTAPLHRTLCETSIDRTEELVVSKWQVIEAKRNDRDFGVPCESCQRLTGIAWRRYTVDLPACNALPRSEMRAVLGCSIRSGGESVCRRTISWSTQGFLLEPKYTSPRGQSSIDWYSYRHAYIYICVWNGEQLSYEPPEFCWCATPIGADFSIYCWSCSASSTTFLQHALPCFVSWQIIACSAWYGCVVFEIYWAIIPWFIHNDPFVPVGMIPMPNV
jgi:hypothetical protein